MAQCLMVLLLGVPQAGRAQDSAGSTAVIDVLPGMLPVIDPFNLYSEAAVGRLSPTVGSALPRVYVPNVKSGDVDVIDPETLKIVDRFKVVRNPQHVVPSWDLRTLWVTNSAGRRHGQGSLLPIDPVSGKSGSPIPVPDAYNMYFMPDGSAAIVVAESRRQLEFRDPRTMALRRSISTPQCNGLNHAEFAIDWRYAIFTCEFGGSLVKIDLVQSTVVGSLRLSKGGMPQDIRISPDGKVFYGYRQVNQRVTGSRHT